MIASLELADYTVKVHWFAGNLLLLSRVSSDAYEPCVFLKGHSDKSLSPGGQSDLLWWRRIVTESVAESVSGNMVTPSHNNITYVVTPVVIHGAVSNSRVARGE